MELPEKGRDAILKNTDPVALTGGVSYETAEDDDERCRAIVSDENRDISEAAANLRDNEDSETQFEKLAEDLNKRHPCEDTYWLKFLPKRVDITDAVLGLFANAKLASRGAEKEAKTVCDVALAERKSEDILTT
jgi:hypothetical protein